MFSPSILELRKGLYALEIDMLNGFYVILYPQL